jgi:hypothetical protein
MIEGEQGLVEDDTVICQDSYREGWEGRKVLWEMEELGMVHAWVDESGNLKRI